MRIIDEGRRMLNALGIDPVYIVQAVDPLRTLTDRERRFMFSQAPEGGIAFTSPVADIIFKHYLRYDWQGRGFACVFVQSPLTMSDAETLGVLLHEAGHYVAGSARPERDDMDTARAVKTFWESMPREAEHHNRRWLQSTIHLWHRACRAGHEIPLSDVVNLEQYGFTRDDLAPLLDDAVRGEGEPIESLLTTPGRSRRTQPGPWQRLPDGTYHTDGGERFETLPALLDATAQRRIEARKRRKVNREKVITNAQTSDRALFPTYFAERELGLR